jgi:hypothetical protein
MTTIIERWVETDEGEIVQAVEVDYYYRASAYRDPDAEFIEIENATLPDGTPVKLTDEEFRAVCDVAAARIDYATGDHGYTGDEWRIGQDRFERSYY